MEADRTVCSSHQISVCVRLFLEKREKLLLNFVNHFRDSCSALDEKIALMERFLASLWSQLEADTSVMLLTVKLISISYLVLLRNKTFLQLFFTTIFAYLMQGGFLSKCHSTCRMLHFEKKKKIVIYYGEKWIFVLLFKSHFSNALFQNPILVTTWWIFLSV